MNTVKHLSLRTAILLFAQSDSAETVVKPIAHSKMQSTLLWHKMNEKVLQTIRKTKLPFFKSDENTQEGISFGEKLSHAVQGVFDQGFDKVIIIGNDTPGLTLQHIKKAYSSLQDTDLVLGPDHKGGAYLIGLSKSNFKKHLFATISWRTSQVIKQLKTFSTHKCVVLKPLSDFNTSSDLSAVLKELSYITRIKSNLLSLLLFQLFLNRFIGAVYNYNVLGFNFNKGSPAIG